MKHIDLGPNDYRKFHPATQRFVFPDDRKLARNYFFVLIGVLVYVFVVRNEVTSAILFGTSSLFSFCAGCLFAVWFKDRY